MGGKSSKESCCGNRPSRKSSCLSSSRTPCYGLVSVPSRKPVPLQEIWVDVQVKGFVVDVSVTLRYENKKRNVVEAVFIFPVDEDRDVYSFEATIDGKTIIALLHDKKQVYASHDGAVHRPTFDPEEDEIFSCIIGNLPPGRQVEVTLKYVQELPVKADGAVRFVLPAVLSPPQPTRGGCTASTMVALRMDAFFKSSYGIAKIESNYNITPPEYPGNDKTSAKVSLAEGQTFDRDVELLAYYTDVNQPSVMVEAGLGSEDAGEQSGAAPTGSLMAEPVAMLNFFSNFPEAMEDSSHKEFIFLVDRSASMKCTITKAPNLPRRIESAKETLVLLLKSLPLGSYFNIIGFGSHFESFFPESVEYTQLSMEEALEKVNVMDASLGGTEILEPLKNIYETAGKNGRYQQLFVFTDGEVEKEKTKEVIAEVQKNAHTHQCFTFGIGCGVSTPLVIGMAQAGNGTFQFISDKERMQPQVLQTVKRSLQPIARNVSLTWMLPPGMEPAPLSRLPNVFFQGHRSIFYVQLKGKLEKEAEGEVWLQYELDDEIVKNHLKFPLSLQNSERATFHRLAAKALICDLENGTDPEEVKNKILMTSLQSGVVSSLTAFVAFDKDTKKRIVGPPVEEDVPDPALRGHGGHFGHGLRPDLYDYGGHFHCGPRPAPHILHGHYISGPEAGRLISLQNADGSWNLSQKFSDVLGISKTVIKDANPDQNVPVSVWVTVLAVMWLHTSCRDHRAEWELLERKAVCWVRAKAGPSLSELVRAGNELLKSSVDLSAFDL